MKLHLNTENLVSFIEEAYKRDDIVVHIVTSTIRTTEMASKLPTS